MTTFEIPQRITHIPEWLFKREGFSDKQIADDIIAIQYWTQIDKQAEVNALREAKKQPGWNVRKLPENQEPDVYQFYIDQIEAEKERLSDVLQEDTYARARALAEGADASYDWLENIGLVLEQAQMRVVLKMQDNALYPYLEYSNAAEWLMSKKIPSGDGKQAGLNYDIDFLSGTLIPLLEKNGISKEIVVGVADNLSKSRFAVPYLRKILDETVTKMEEIKFSKEQAEKQGASKKELVLFDDALDEAMKLDKRLYETIEALVTEMSMTAKGGGMSVAEFRKHLKSIYKGKGHIQVQAEGYLYTTEKGGVILVNCETTRLYNAIKTRLGELVDFHLASTEDLASEVAKRLMASGKSDELKKELLKGAINENGSID